MPTSKKRGFLWHRKSIRFSRESQNLPINTILLAVISVFILAILIVLISQNIAQTSKTTIDLTIDAPPCPAACIAKSQCEQQRGIEINKNCAQSKKQLLPKPIKLGNFDFQRKISKSKEEIVCCI